MSYTEVAKENLQISDIYSMVDSPAHKASAYDRYVVYTGATDDTLKLFETHGEVIFFRADKE